MTRRTCLMTLSALFARAADRLPANKNVKWALGSNLWNSFPLVPFTDILDVMRDTGFIGIRLTQFPQILSKYSITAEQMEAEVNKRHLHVITISFSSPPADKPDQHDRTIVRAKEAMTFLKRFGANHLVVFSPRRGQTPETFRLACKFFNRLGETANEMGFKAGLHNHLGQMVQTPEEIDRCMELTDPRLFHFSPDTAHVHLGGGNVPQILEKYKHRLMLADYKDAKREGLSSKPGGRFLPNIFDLGDGEIDFPACHRVLKSISFKGWLCVDLDIARAGIRTSYERCGAYIVKTLEPIYV
jgi:inosose dehydratase